MKKLLILFIFSFLSFTINAQESYTVDGKTYELKTEAKGEITLLWNIIDGNYRYFIKKGGDIVELTNTKDSDNKYLEEYKETLNSYTEGSNLSTKKVKLTLYSLRTFVNKYNSLVDTSYEPLTKNSKVKSRVQVFGGITNHPFVENPDNETGTQFGAEIEIFEAANLSRHALFLNLRHATDSDKLPYSLTQIGLGYRFKIINKDAFNLHTNVTVATVNFSKTTVEIEDAPSQDISDTAFDAPFIFGVGADIRVSENSFITLSYNELFSLFLDNQGNFSTNLTLGYKFNL